jgi:mannose-1-phosphate guanylyltransferase
VIAVLLVGGQGTRLLPLTEWLPKPMLPIANRPFLEHQVAHLRHHGATRVILACGYKPDAIRDHFGDELEYVVEDLNLTALVAFHRSRRATATIALQPVDDPSRYGLVRTTAHGEVEAFIEKPEPGQVDVNTINAGTYVMEPEVLDLVPPDVAVSVEREVFPELVGNGLYGRAERVSWIDIGTPQSYLEANLAEMGPNGTVDPSAVIDQAAEVRDSVVGPGATVGAGARVTRSVLLPGARVEPEAVVTEQVIGMDGPVW